MSSGEICSIALIGKHNNPLYIKNFSNAHPDLKYHYIAHTSIDVIEERVTNGPKNHDLYLGLLYAMEDLAVYGYMSNTRVKFVIVVSATDGIIRDADIKTAFKKIHSAYEAHICNPFYSMDSQRPLDSDSFTRAIDSLGLKTTSFGI